MPALRREIRNSNCCSKNSKLNWFKAVSRGFSNQKKSEPLSTQPKGAFYVERREHDAGALPRRLASGQTGEWGARGGAVTRRSLEPGTRREPACGLCEPVANAAGVLVHLEQQP